MEKELALTSLKYGLSSSLPCNFPPIISKEYPSFGQVRPALTALGPIVEGKILQDPLTIPASDQFIEKIIHTSPVEVSDAAFANRLNSSFALEYITHPLMQ